ncbi:MAG: hypothetical protein J7M34_05295 [Anaerolineae bacterium]|nr:hypothetical protein [Anaerolineae bacterium]
MLHSRLLKIAYQLHRYECNGRPLDRWLGTLLVLIALLGLPRWIPGGRWTTLVTTLLLIGLIAFEIWARRSAYVRFVQQGEATRHPRSDGGALRPEDKIAIRATGQFEVEDRSRFFVNLQAYFRTFATREHAVMAYVPRSRFLWMARWPENEIGMWYMFFLPEDVMNVEPGLLYFGDESSPALRVTCRHEERQKTVYLTFSHEEDRQRVWCDILWDAASTQ